MKMRVRKTSRATSGGRIQEAAVKAERNWRKFWLDVRVALADLIDPSGAAEEQQARKDASLAFHTLWTKAAQGEPYEKPMWNDLDYQLTLLGVGAPSERSGGTRGASQGDMPDKRDLRAKSPRTWAPRTLVKLLAVLVLMFGPILLAMLVVGLFLPTSRWGDGSLLIVGLLAVVMWFPIFEAMRKWQWLNSL